MNSPVGLYSGSSSKWLVIWDTLYMWLSGASTVFQFCRSGAGHSRFRFYFQGLWMLLPLQLPPPFSSSSSSTSLPSLVDHLVCRSAQLLFLLQSSVSPPLCCCPCRCTALYPASGCFLTRSHVAMAKSMATGWNTLCYLVLRGEP